MDDDLEALAGGDRTGTAVHAGFPNPAADRPGESPLSLDRLLIAHPSSTYLFRVSGDNWVCEGVFDGDIAVVDRALDARRHDLVVGWQHNRFTLSHFGPSHHLRPWGVVRSIIHEYRRPLTHRPNQNRNEKLIT